jgi:hypothetical protein
MELVAGSVGVLVPYESCWCAKRTVLLGPSSLATFSGVLPDESTTRGSAP